MTYPILQVGETVLRQPARQLTVAEILSSEIQDLIGVMQQTMYAAPGVGLAAPQIGKSLQLVVMEDRQALLQTLPANLLRERERYAFPFQVLINPELIVEQTEQAFFFEGCLSVDGMLGLVPRYRSVKVQALNEHAQPVEIKATGWHARIIQHELDHLQGILCIDHMLPKSMMTTENYRKYWQDQTIACTCQALNISSLPSYS